MFWPNNIADKNGFSIVVSKFHSIRVREANLHSAYVGETGIALSV